MLAGEKHQPGGRCHVRGVASSSQFESREVDNARSHPFGRPPGGDGHQPPGADAQDVRYYQDPNNGVTYKETNQTINRQVPVTQYQPSSRTVLRGQYRTETQGVARTYSVPVTEYRWESYWQGRFNPFAQPTLRKLVPYTRWETHSDVVNVPVTRYETVPTTETVHVPVTTWHTVQDQITHRTAMTPPTAGSSAVVSTVPVGNSVGGVARLDPPPVLGGDTSQAGSSGSKTALSR